MSDAPYTLADYQRIQAEKPEKDYSQLRATIEALNAAQAELAEWRKHPTPFRADSLLPLAAALKQFAAWKHDLLTGDRGFEAPADVVFRLGKERDAAQARVKELEGDAEAYAETLSALTAAGAVNTEAAARAFAKRRGITLEEA
jgi:hypothetical protein